MNVLHTYKYKEFELVHTYLFECLWVPHVNAHKWQLYALGGQRRVY